MIIQVTSRWSFFLPGHMSLVVIGLDPVMQCEMTCKEEGATKEPGGKRVLATE
jgi:hypothetical protein